MPRRKPRRRGRKTLLTPTRQARILELIEQGNHIATACAHVGIGTSTLYRWLEQAEEYDETIAAGQPPDDAKRVYAEFRDGYWLARARAEENAVRVIQRSMAGGFVLSEEPLIGADGDVLRNDNGEILWKRTYSQPDGRLALAYLARISPDRWGQNPQRVEVSGPGGSAVQVQHQVGQIEALAERLHAVAAERRADLELEAGEDDGVTDAEVVEDDDAAG